MKKLFLLSLSTFVIYIANGQTKDSLMETIYEQKTIYLDESSSRYVKNNERIKIGLFGKKLKKEFNNSSIEAQEEIANYEKLSKRQTIFLTAGGVILIATFIAIPPLSVIIPSIITPIYYSSLGISLAANTIGIIQAKKKTKHLSKAIWLHNKDVLIKLR